MIITEKVLPVILKGKNLDDLKTIYLESKTINKIVLKSNVFENVLFLSLCGNNIKDIEFISCFRNLWYLDLSDNPVNNFLLR